MGRKSKQELAREIEEVSLFRKDVANLAKQCIRNYFKSKYVLNTDDLFSTHSIQTLLRTDFERGFDYAHSHLLCRLSVPPDWNDPTLSWQVFCLLKLLEEMRSLDIPTMFHPGMILLFFKFCKGWEIPDPPPL